MRFYSLIPSFIAVAYGTTIAARLNQGSSVADFLVRDINQKIQEYDLVHAPRNEIVWDKLSSLLMGGRGTELKIQSPYGTADRTMDGQKSLVFHPSISEYLFIDHSLPGYSEFTKSDSLEIFGISTRIAERILGSRGKKFTFVNEEVTYSESPGQPPQVSYICLRFLERLDERFILGTSNQIRIEFGNANRIRMLSIRIPEFSAPRDLQRIVKRQSIEKRLRKYAIDKKTAISPEGTEIEVTELNLKKGIGSFIVEKRGGKEVLTPHVTFLSENKTSDGKLYFTHLNFSEDGASVPNLEDSDYINIGPK